MIPFEVERCWVALGVSLRRNGDEWCVGVLDACLVVSLLVLILFLSLLVSFTLFRGVLKHVVSVFFLVSSSASYIASEKKIKFVSKPDQELSATMGWREAAKPFPTKCVMHQMAGYLVLGLVSFQPVGGYGVLFLVCIIWACVQQSFICFQYDFSVEAVAKTPGI